MAPDNFTLLANLYGILAINYKKMSILMNIQYYYARNDQLYTV
jgi:hypothetical protein